MTHIDRLPLPGRVLDTDADLEDTIGALLKRACNPRQIWLMFLDEQQRLTPLIMPCDDLPLAADHPTPTDDLGVCGVSHLLAQRLRQIVDEFALAQAVLVWERVGSSHFTSADREWALAMAAECAAVGVRLRAQFVLHSDGIRPLTPDDYAGV
jgi:hypothetical protein